VDEVLNPFYVFQILSIVLWCFDEYIYYATCVVVISAISISISLVETRTQSLMLKDMAQGSEHSLITVRTANDGTILKLVFKDFPRITPHVIIKDVIVFISHFCP